MAPVLPAVADIEDSAIVFMEVLSKVASEDAAQARRLRRYVENGPGTLSEWKLEKVRGTLANLRGFMPEEIATRMGFFDSIFHKNAFEMLADFPPALRSKMKVEMVEGPLWVMDATGTRQFGDGCMLLTGPDNRSVIVGLGELKAGFDEDLLQQLFVKSDGRAVNSVVTFFGRNLDKEGALDNQVRTLTREFALENGKKVAVTKPPIYIYGRPLGETPEEAAAFKEMVDEEMKSGREMYKIQLPFSATSNSRFAEEALKESVKILKKAKSSWGR